MAELEAEAHKLAGRPFNLGTPKQIGDVLFGEHGPARRQEHQDRRRGRPTLLRAGGPGAPRATRLPRTCSSWRQLSKLKGTYTDALARRRRSPRPGRVHTSYALAATTTGRLSSTDPNLQNIPVRTEEGRKIRQAFVAEPGNAADQRRLQPDRAAAAGPHRRHPAAEGRPSRDGLDIHAMTASEMFGVPVEGMPAEMRRRAKAINFGIIYGISAFGLANQLGIPQDEAGAYIKTYFERFPGIRDYMEGDQGAGARARLRRPRSFGRKIHLPDDQRQELGRAREFAERAAINAPIQGAAADIIRRAMIRMPRALKAAAGLKARMLLQVHDELVFEAPRRRSPRP